MPQSMHLCLQSFATRMSDQAYLVQYPYSSPDCRSHVPLASQSRLCRIMQGYGITYSAFGYGNETVLCNDPHLTPWTDLDNVEVNQQAVEKSNSSVKECRIGPWVFPIQVTNSFLPKGLCEGFPEALSCSIRVLWCLDMRCFLVVRRL